MFAASILRLVLENRMEWLPAIIAYVVSLGAYALSKRQELRDPTKAQRYRVLPIHYKLACWCGVLPLLAAIPLALLFVFHSPTLASIAPVLGLIAYVSLEIACVSIYRKHGLWG